MFWFCDQFNAKEVRIWESNIKGALDKYNIIPPTFFQKSWHFYTIRSVGIGNDGIWFFTV